MSSSHRLKKMPLRDREFSCKIAEEVKNLNRCYQCSICSDGCPAAFDMDYHPSEIVYMARLGLKSEILKSKSIWTCVSCETCSTRCPNEIDIVHLMDVLRSHALREEVKNPAWKIQKFHKAFLKCIRNRGRVDTVDLLLRYEFNTGDVFSSFSKFREQISQGFDMLSKGKMNFGFRKKHQQKNINNIFMKTLDLD